MGRRRQVSRVYATTGYLNMCNHTNTCYGRVPLSSVKYVSIDVRRRFGGGFDPGRPFARLSLQQKGLTLNRYVARVAEECIECLSHRSKYHSSGFSLGLLALGFLSFLLLTPNRGYFDETSNWLASDSIYGFYNWGGGAWKR